MHRQAGATLLNTVSKTIDLETMA